MTFDPKFSSETTLTLGKLSTILLSGYGYQWGLVFPSVHHRWGCFILTLTLQTRMSVTLAPRAVSMRGCVPTRRAATRAAVKWALRSMPMGVGVQVGGGTLLHFLNIIHSPCSLFPFSCISLRKHVSNMDPSDQKM